MNFYPSITADLMKAALDWARTYTHISVGERKIIMEAKKSLIFINGTPWVKKGGSEFDIAQGSYDGAEACELVGLYILSKLQDLNIDVGIYRDDGLAATCATPRQVEGLKKKIKAIFNKLGLEITIEANLKIINFLDICMDLEADTFKPYIKPNTTPLYIHSKSNHPPTVIRNLPAAINKRLSSISCNKEVFDKAAPTYRDALAKSGYKYDLEFDPEAANQKQKHSCRKRNITWFNPPFSQNVKTKVGGKFLKLIESCFPPEHPLKKICNRNTLKLSYRCTPNIGSVISAKNSKLLQPPQPEKKMCNCKAGNTCPMNGKCQDSGVIYKTTVKQETGYVNTYTGLTCNDFKTRWYAHTHSFNNIEAKQTTLSSHIHKLKANKVNYDLEWEIIDHARPFNPVTGICALCTKEKYYIAKKPAWATLNKRSEMFASCRHKIRMLLCGDIT